MIFVNDPDGEIGHLGRGACRDCVDGEAKSIDDKSQHDGVGKDASNLLDHQPIDIDGVPTEAAELLRLRLLQRCLFLRVRLLSNPGHFTLPASAA
jgi:hypothetical protein